LPLSGGLVVDDTAVVEVGASPIEAPERLAFGHRPLRD
jgi:hypothetical protein